MAAGNKEGSYKVEELAQVLESMGDVSDVSRAGTWTCTVKWPVKNVQPAGAPSEHCGDGGRAFKSFIVRLYNHAVDFEPLQEMCRDVYEGEDNLPAIMDKVYAGDDKCRALVVQSSAGVAGFVAVCYWPSGSSWEFGLRVLASEEGQGLGTLLIRCMLTLAAHERKRAVFASTIIANAPSRQIMRKLGYRMLQPVVIWPQFSQLDAILAGDVTSRQLAGSLGAAGPGPDLPPEASSNSASSTQLPQLNSGGGGGRPPTMLEAGNIPWLGDADVASLAARWRPCTGLDELESYLCAARGDLEAEGDAYAEISRELWLPMYYYVAPVRGAAVGSALAEGRVWVLGDLGDRKSLRGAQETGPPSSGGDGFEASRGDFGIMFVAEDWQFSELRKGVSFVSIVATSKEVAKGGMLHASSLEHRFLVVADIRRPDDRRLWAEESLDDVDKYLVDRTEWYWRSLFGHGEMHFASDFIVLGRCLP